MEQGPLVLQGLSCVSAGWVVPLLGSQIRFLKTQTILILGSPLLSPCLAESSLGDYGLFPGQQTQCGLCLFLTLAGPRCDGDCCQHSPSAQDILDAQLIPAARDWAPPAAHLLPHCRRAPALSLLHAGCAGEKGDLVPRGSGLRMKALNCVWTRNRAPTPLMGGCGVWHGNQKGMARGGPVSGAGQALPGGTEGWAAGQGRGPSGSFSALHAGCLLVPVASG